MEFVPGETDFRLTTLGKCENICSWYSKADFVTKQVYFVGFLGSSSADFAWAYSYGYRQ